LDPLIESAGMKVKGKQTLNIYVYSCKLTALEPKLLPAVNGV